jgi:hypothetical protein
MSLFKIVNLLDVIVDIYFILSWLYKINNYVHALDINVVSLNAEYKVR